MDSKVRKLLTNALDVAEDADDETLEEALSNAGVEGGRLFTQEEANTLLAANKKGLRAENEHLRRQMEDATALLGKLQGAEAPPGADLRSQIKRIAGRLTELDRELAGAMGSRAAAEAKALDSERDRVLVSAASRAGMIDPEGEGLALFRDRAKRSGDGAWRFVDDSGDECDLDEGFARVLDKRKHLLRASMRPGAGSGRPREVDPMASALGRLRSAEDSKINPRDDRTLFGLADAVLDVGRARRGGL